MKRIICPTCGGKTKRNGKTSSGAQRWRCTSCGASTTVRYDNTVKLFAIFLNWLLSKRS
jgi:transposase-like protein